MPTSHRLSFPTCLSHPRSIHLLCHLDSPSAANLPCLGLQQQTDRKSPSSVAATGFLPGALSFLHTLSHLERVAHRPGNLSLQPQPPLSPGESVVYAGQQATRVKHCMTTTVNWEHRHKHPNDDRQIQYITRLNNYMNVSLDQPTIQDRLMALVSGMHDKQPRQVDTDSMVQTEGVPAPPEINTGLSGFRVA
jgi:hypothetical protein